MTAQQTIFLHVGSGKTGSSYLQAAALGAQDRLAACGIDFPIEDRTRKRAAMGRVITGNMRPTETMQTVLARYPDAQNSQKLLFSNETLSLTLTQPDDVVAGSIRAAFPDARIEVLCYIRDPLDHALSSYGQVVKRNGFTRDCATFLRRYDGPARLVMLADAIDRIGGHLTILNYSRHRDDLLDTFQDWLGVPRGTVPPPDQPQVNRSLTRAELELQRAFNRHLGQFSSVLISEPLSEMLPNIRSERPRVSRDDLSAFLDRMRRTSSSPRLRALIPDAEWFRIGTVEDHAALIADPAEDDAFRLNGEQINLLAASISSAIKKAAPELAAQLKGTDPTSGSE